MDAKAPLLPRTEPDAMPRRTARRCLNRFHAAAFFLVVGLFWLARSWQCMDPYDHEGETAAKVPLEAHIM
jgi:hypothetical protein